jgi:hypothetical protein
MVAGRRSRLIYFLEVTMKKVIFASLFLLATYSLFAQSGNGYIDILPGHQFGQGTSKPGLTGSLDFAHTFNKNLGLHFGLWVNQGRFAFTCQQEKDLGREELGPGLPPNHRFAFTQAFSVFEFGPEFTTPPARWGQVYFQANFGHTIGLGRTLDVWPTRTIQDDLTFGFAVGNRLFFRSGVGFAGQIAYHHLDGTGTDHWDARVGLVIKLPSAGEPCPRGFN